MLFTRKRKDYQINITIRDHSIQSKNTVKYLGLLLDKNLNFVEHTRMVTRRTDDATKRLTRIMPNTGGTKTHRRKLLVTVLQSIMLYSATVWSKHMGKDGWTMLDRSNRKISLKVTAAYRTVSKEAVEIISVMPLPELMKGEERKRTEDRLIQEWQSRLDHGELSSYHYRLIPSILSWFKWKHVMINYHLTQALTGHGCYSSYLRRFERLASPFACSAKIK